MKLEDLEFGMRIRNSFKTALDRQVGEAVAISREQRAGTELLNSKAEFNRCKIQRLDTRSEKEKMKEISDENDIESKLKVIIKKMKGNKRERSKENKQRTREMKAALIEIQNENLSKWRKRKKIQEKANVERDIKEKESLERLKRKNIGEIKKKKVIKTLRSKEKKVEWLKEKTGHWRQHREKCEIVLPKDVTDFRLNVNSVNGNSENTVEDCLDAISEIGHKIEIKLKETVFRSKFSDLKQSEYLRQTELKAVCES